MWFWFGKSCRPSARSHRNFDRICCNKVVSCPRNYAQLKRLHKINWYLECWMHFSRNAFKYATFSWKTLYLFDRKYLQNILLFPTLNTCFIIKWSFLKLQIHATGESHAIHLKLSVVANNLKNGPSRTKYTIFSI